MRREWSTWIRNRQWTELEKLAKSEPSQPLADTVAELELGFPEKADRRALRKILYSLKQAGFEPQEIEDPESEPQARTEAFEAAFMQSSDDLGESVILYGLEDRGRVSWLHTHVSYFGGVTVASDETTSLDEAHSKLIRLRNLTPRPFVAAVVPTSFVLARLADAVQKTKILPSVMAYWRSQIPKPSSDPHPAVGLPRVSTTIDELHEVIQNEEAIGRWRLEMGIFIPMFKELVELTEWTENELQKERIDDVIDSMRQGLFTDKTAADHHLRLLDLAYLYHIRGMTNAGPILGLADELQRHGAESQYAKVVFRKSFMVFITWLRENQQQGAKGWKGN